MEFLFQIGLVIFLVLLNGYFVASEFALVSIRRTRVRELVKKGNRTAKLLDKALGDLDSYISATQLGITIASLALGWIGEPAISHNLEPLFAFLPHSAAFITAHTLSVAISFILITALHIVIGELAPKSLALQRVEQTSLFVITPLLFFSRIFKPFIWVLNEAGKLVIRTIGLHAGNKTESLYSEDEIKFLLRQSSQGGQIPSREVEMVYNVFQLGDTSVRSIMIPRTDILAFRAGATISEVVEQIEDHPHSRFPVYENSIDSIIGFIHVKDIYKEVVKKNGTKKLSQLGIIRQIITVPEGKKVDSLLQDMRKRRIHLAVVNDEFGGTAGIVTLEDALESLVGEIEDEFDEPVKNIARLKDGSYLIRGDTPINDLVEKFNTKIKAQEYTTLGGLVFGMLGHEPKVSDEVIIADLKVRVEKIEGKRIQLLNVKKIPLPSDTK